MNDPTSQSFSKLPFFILALLSAVAVFDARKPLESLRPHQSDRPTETERSGSETKRSEQRTWEDPFKIDFFDDGTLVTDDLPDLSGADRKMLMQVSLPGGSRASLQERRSRRRYAIHLALGQAGYRSKQPGSVYIANLDLSTELADKMNSGVPVSLEVFELDPLSRRWYSDSVGLAGDSAVSVALTQNLKGRGSPPFHSIVVAYIRSGDLAKKPLGRMKDSAAEITKLLKLQSPEVRAIGPDSSNLVFELLQELSALATQFADENGIDLPMDVDPFMALVAVQDEEVNEAIRQSLKTPASYTVFSPTATSDFATLINQDPNAAIHKTAGFSGYNPTWRDRNQSVLSLARAREVVRMLSEVNYVRTVHNDSAVFTQLIEELINREAIEDPQHLNRVALIVESDTRYGRAAPLNFLKGAQSVVDPNAKISPTNPSAQAYFEKLHHPAGFSEEMGKIRVFSYLSGIDGTVGKERSTSGPSQSTNSETSHWAGNTRPWTDPPPRGNHQIDYIRRLADEIAKESRAVDSPIRAIGILGTDIYDKLLLLRALRPLLPDVVFFTTDLDAHLWYAQEVEFTRNLLVGSSHGLSLSENLQQLIPPFRDSYQTSIFGSVLMAAETIERPYEIDEYKPQVFEIGFNGPVYLGGGDLFEGASENQELLLFDVPKNSNRNWVNITWIVFFAVLIAVTVAFQLSLNNFDKALRPLSRVLLRHGCQVACALFLLGILANLFVTSDVIEPMSLTDGVSAWPAFFINIFASFVALSFCIYISVTRSIALPRVFSRYTRVNRAESYPSQSQLYKGLRQEFGLYLGSTGCGAIYGLLFSSAMKSTAWSDAEYWVSEPLFWLALPIASLGGFVAWKLWSELSRFCKQNAENETQNFLMDSRFLRCFALPLLLMMILTYVWGIASGHNFLPIRSLGLRRVFEFTQLFQTTSMLTLLTYVVFEAIWIVAFIGCLYRRERGYTQWDPHNLLQDPPETSSELQNGQERLSRATRCVYLVSQLTEIPNRYLFYPFIVLFLSILAQQREFDGWAWLEYRWIITALLFGVCILPAAMMRVAASNLRSRVCQSLNQLSIDKSYEKPIGAAGNQPQDIVDELRKISRGAYAPFFSQPLILAALTPMGGLGSLALLRILVEATQQ